jgi:hypothetical protein
MKTKNTQTFKETHSRKMGIVVTVGLVQQLHTKSGTKKIKTTKIGNYKKCLMQAERELLVKI